MSETYDIRGLEEFGIIALTGEACGLAMRTLCDCTQEGIELIREFMRVDPIGSPWNSKGVKSVLLPNSIFPDLWVFAHVRKGTKYVFSGGYVNLDQWTETKYEAIDVTLKHPVPTWRGELWATDDDNMVSRLKEQEGIIFYFSRWYKRSDAPGTGLDNRHAMTGRIS